MKWLNSDSSDRTDFPSLFNEWNEVFVKIVHVLKHEFKLSYSVENFGQLLVKISIKVINQLIMTLNSASREEIKARNPLLHEQMVEFERSLLKHSRTISSFIDNQFELLISQSDLQRSASSLEFDKTSTDPSMASQEQLSSTNRQLSLLLDDELAPDDLEDWALVNRCVFRKTRELISANRLKECEAILVRMGLPVDQVFYFVLIKSFDATLVGNLLSYFKAKQLYPQLVEQIELQQEIWSLLDFGQFSINFSSLSSANEQKIKNLIITGLIRLERNSQERTNQEVEQSIEKLAKWVDDRSLFTFLLDCNERELIVSKLNRLNITESMLDYCIENGQELTKQHLLYNLTKNKIHPQLVERPNLVLKRLYSNCDNKNAQKFCLLCRTGLFANSFKSSQFQDRLIHYAIQIKQFDFVYWFLKQENNIKILRNSKLTDPLVKGVICSLFDYRSDNASSVKLLNVVLQYCKYFNPHLTINNINDLFAAGLIKEAISCMFLAPTGFNDSSLSPLQIWFMKPDVVLASLKASYPILYEAFNHSLIDFQQQQVSMLAAKALPYQPPDRSEAASDASRADVPDLYSLLKGTIIFDINKLFYWQSTNAYAQSNGPRTIPTFSNPQLAEKFGLKANLNYIYYLTRGRPIEAYYQEIVNKNQMDPKQIQAIYRKVSLLAFYNCLDSSIVCSCVAFLELLQLNSGSLTFQIAFARLIMKYAADFLTLKRADQQEKMGDLLNKACFEENKLAQTNILELIYMALGRKYEKNEKPLMEECIDYEVAVLFARKYSLDLPTQFLMKCIRNDDWLFLTVYVQIYEYPKEVFEHLLKDKDGSLFNNGCVAEHLSKAFASIAYLSDSAIESATGSKDAKQNVSRTKNNLYLRIVQRKMHANKFARPSSSPQFQSSNRYSPSDHLTNSPTDSADLDLINADTVTIASSLSEYEGLTFDAFNSPKVKKKFIITTIASNF